MTLWQTVLLAVVQGIAEFLPISSSGHLTILQALFDASNAAPLPDGSHLEMNVALHLGTLFSILLYYRREVFALLRDPKLLAVVVLASVPVAAVGLLFKDQITSAFESPLVAGCCLLLTAGLLLFGQFMDRYREREASRLHEQAPAVPETLDTEAALAERTASDIVTAPRGLLVGIVQVLAILPGISRSGSTIAAGLTAGLDRETAAKFSFLIALPVIGGAALLEGKDIYEAGGTTTELWLVLLGMAISFLVGWVSLAILIRVLNKDKLHFFAIYCLLAGTATIAWQLSLSPTEAVQSTAAFLTSPAPVLPTEVLQ